MIDTTWSTNRLTITDTHPNDLPQLERVLLSNSSTLLLDGIQNPDPTELQRWLTNGDLPPNGQKDNYRLQTITRRDTSEVIGYLSVYHGHPTPDTFYIASLFIRQDCQKKGFGSELVNQLPLLPALRDYPTHRLVVTVRNWKAVRFWVRHGFTTIAQVIGTLDNDSTTDTARLELTRNSASI